MSENRNWSSTGEQIKGALSEALQTGNFKNLNELVSQTVSDAVSEVGKHVSLGGINIRRSAAIPSLSGKTARKPPRMKPAGR